MTFACSPCTDPAAAFGNAIFSMLRAWDRWSVDCAFTSEKKQHFEEKLFHAHLAVSFWLELIRSNDSNLREFDVREFNMMCC